MAWGSRDATKRGLTAKKRQKTPRQINPKKEINKGRRKTKVNTVFNSGKSQLFLLSNKKKIEFSSAELCVLCGESLWILLFYLKLNIHLNLDLLISGRKLLGSTSTNSDRDRACHHHILTHRHHPSRLTHHNRLSKLQSKWL